MSPGGDLLLPFDRMGRRHITAGVLSIALVVTAGCNDSSSAKGSKKTTTTSKSASAKPTTTAKQLTASMSIWKIVGLDGQFASFAEQAKKAGLDEQLGKDGDLTLFAPNTAAYDALTPDQKAALDPASAALQIVKGRHTFGDLRQMNGKRLDTVDGRQVEIAVNGADVTIGGALIVKSDISADNGVIFVLDRLSVAAG